MQVKICGLKDPMMMEAALAAGADFVGLVFFPKSPRHVEITSAIALASQARGRSKITALLVDPGDKLLDVISARLKPDYIQLHGQETPERCAEIAKNCKLPLIKAIGVSGVRDAERADDYPMADLILFDAKPDPGQDELPGGRGISFDWQVLKGQKERRAFMLSGGLTPETVAEAIKLTGASAVDVSSGVERARGVKDKALIEDFIKAAKQAC